ncbi:MAG: photosystem II protein Psb27 [Xenococcaceae cyanobacterium]
MHLKSYLSRLLALVLVVVIGLMGCSPSVTGLTGNYSQDTSTVLESLTTAIDLPDDASNKGESQALAREQINDYISRYRRDGKVSGLRSFTTMQTALNSLAGYYTSYGNRPLPEKLKTRLKQEFREVELALKRGM